LVCVGEGAMAKQDQTPIMKVRMPSWCTLAVVTSSLKASIAYNKK
jgi:hypothetical protein